MIVISHRGYWKTADEKNRPVAFHRSFDLGFGTETDVRDLAGRLVVSHDMPKGDELDLDGLLAILAGRDLPLAVNIKADGLSAPLAERMRAHALTKWFTFDMSVPEMVVQLARGLPVFTRSSEFEAPPPIYDRAIGVWVDSFGATAPTPALIRGFLADGKRVCIVSPELHGRDPSDFWAALKADGLAEAPDLMLCSDVPERAVEFFGIVR